MPTDMNHAPALSTSSTKSRSRTLFGLPAGIAPTTKVAYPLCDRAGAPACGNVGQPGRPDAPVATRVHCETTGNARGE